MQGISKYTVFNIREYLNNWNDELGEDDLLQVLSEFSCEKNHDVEKFAKEQSIEFAKRQQSVTYLVFSTEDAELVGYFAITVKPITVNAEGYHSKTIAYSLYHIFRIEDIVAHSIIAKDEQIFFAGNYKSRMHSPIITTGNELVKQEIADFSKELDLGGLYQYVYDVDKATSELLRQFTFDDLKKKYTEQDKETVRTLGVVSEDENAVWLIDYWCNKDLKGLIQMPFSRHWIMHIEASLRIRNKVKGE